MAEWHPIMAAVEGPPGVWRMVDPQGREYGRVEIRCVDGGRRIAYRGERGAGILGWASSLRLACVTVHGDMLASLAPAGGAVAGWANSPGTLTFRSLGMDHAARGSHVPVRPSRTSAMVGEWGKQRA